MAWETMAAGTGASTIFIQVPETVYTMGFSSAIKASIVMNFNAGGIYNMRMNGAWVDTFVGMRITIKNMTYADDLKSFGYHSGFYTKGQIVDGAIVRAKGFASIFKTSQSGGHLVSSDVKALMHEQTNGAVVENSGGSFDITGNTNEL